MKNKIINYCEEMSKINTEHIEHAKENLHLIQEGRFGEVYGCPQNFGLEDYIGLCETEDDVKSDIDQCTRCWIKALQTK